MRVTADDTAQLRRYDSTPSSAGGGGGGGTAPPASGGGGRGGSDHCGLGAGMNVMTDSKVVKGRARPRVSGHPATAPEVTWRMVSVRTSIARTPREPILAPFPLPWRVPY